MNWAIIWLLVIPAGFILSGKRLAARAAGPRLLSLQCPIAVRSVGIHGDQTVSACLVGRKGRTFEFCMDGRESSATRWRVFMNAEHPAVESAELLPEGCVYERELQCVLEHVVEGNYGLYVEEPVAGQANGAAVDPLDVAVYLRPVMEVLTVRAADTRVLAERQTKECGTSESK